jgi:chromosome segregation ATPase
MSKNNVIIALVVLCLVGTIWGSVQDKKSESLERQIAAMKEQSHAAPVQAEAGEVAGASNEALTTAQEQVDALTSQNKELLENAATLKGTISSLKKEIEESDNGAQAVATLQGELDTSVATVAKLEETVAAGKADIAEKVAALAVAEEAAADFESVKNTLANSIDAYSEKSQELSTALENADLRVAALEKALEERTKLLVSNGKELSRTKLNMNVLLSRIAAQNNSLAILEETRIALEKELASKFLVIEELQHQLNAQAVVDAVIEEQVVEEVAVVKAEEALVAPAEESAPAE